MANVVKLLNNLGKTEAVLEDVERLERGNAIRFTKAIRAFDMAQSYFAILFSIYFSILSACSSFCFVYFALLTISVVLLCCGIATMKSVKKCSDKLVIDMLRY